MNQKIRTRFAPSPTGFLHVGGLRTALYAYLFAKKNNGQFFLRIEDTDQSRKVAGADKYIKESLKNFGLDWQGKIVYQSKRLKIYQAQAKKLVETGHAYYCFCSPEKIEAIRQQKQAQKLPTLHECNCPLLNQEAIIANLKNKQPFVIRLKVPKIAGMVKFKDQIRGEVAFDYKTIDDQVLLKSDGYPTYHLANVIDDHDMGITHVIRGEEWLPSTPKHILLYQAFGWPVPNFAHLPLLLNPDRSKLSKRQGDVAVGDYLKKGYLKEALLNFVLLLGWNPGDNKEIFSLAEMVKAFSLEKVHKSGAVFDVQKLDWINGQYIRNLSLDQFADLVLPFFKAAKIKTNKKALKPIIATEQSRIKRLDEIVLATEFFFVQPKYDANLLIWKQMTNRQVAIRLAMLSDKLLTVKNKDWRTDFLEGEVKEFLAEQKIGVGEMLWPMRVALSGRKASPGPFEIAEVLGQKETIKRLKFAIDLLGWA
ncbi:MAG: glutamate--tRNA ligase [Candidatus Buchananbacteria bacterium]|nr:glutamate--tRNA ligase [Candidatus Buchananbacteria bacterium]